MNPIAWELAKIAMCGGAAFALICALSAYGCYRLGPEEEIEELKKRKRG